MKEAMFCSSGSFCSSFWARVIEGKMLEHCVIVSSGPVTARQCQKVYIFVKLQAFQILF
jgi:uroporphyrinogen-III synthase